jgi:ATP/maltotriose-dependent transcriptional regulator MalT
MTGREILLSHPSPSKMVLRIIMLSGCIAVCSVAIAVLHIPLANRPALLLFSAIPVFMVISAELFGQMKSKRKSLEAQPAMAQPIAAGLAEFGEVRALVHEIASAQGELAKEIMLGQQRLADQLIAVASQQSEQAGKNQELFARLFEQLDALRADVIMLEQPVAPQEIGVPLVVAERLQAVQTELDQTIALMHQIEGETRESVPLRGKYFWQRYWKRPVALTPRETQVYASMSAGKTDSEIAELLGMPLQTVKTMMTIVRTKLARQSMETALEQERAEER